ncbi:MAG: AMP-binding protein [Aeromicrobium sp.]
MHTANPPVLATLDILVRSRLLSLLRPDKYIRMVREVRRSGVTATTGIALAAIRCPHRRALVDERGVMTFRELDDSSHALAAALESRGIRPGDRVGMLCRNHRGFVQALAAIGRVGADAVLLNTAFAAPQLGDVIAREGVELLIYDAEFQDLVDDSNPPESLDRILAWTDGASDCTTLDLLIEESRGLRATRPPKPGRVVLLTSGTTGLPKGASRGGGGDIGTLAAMLQRIPWRSEETVVVAAPMFHAWGFGQLLIAATMACTVVMTRRFDPESTLAAADRERATGIAVVPVMLERIVDLPEDVLCRYVLNDLRFVTASGSRMRPDAVTEFMDRYGDTVYNSYNATEAGMIAIATPAELRASQGTAGRPVAGVDVRLLNDEGTEVRVGEVGEIFVRSVTTFDGYTSGETKPIRDGYMSSGDLGSFDAAGLLSVVGRVDDMIVSGGENVFPIEVEESLLNHPDVVEAAVLGVEDHGFGQRLSAWVALRPDALTTSDELKRHVRANLGSYKVPRDVFFIAQLPRNAAGKVVKRELLKGSV